MLSTLKTGNTPSGTQREPGDVVLSRVEGVEFKMVYCPAGEFMMGGDGKYDGKPTHRVAITEPFLIGQTQVTQAQWEAIMKSNPSRRKGVDLPVDNDEDDEQLELTDRDQCSSTWRKHRSVSSLSDCQAGG